jgi:uncharacterized LabA/DUF88 family protein
MSDRPYRPAICRVHAFFDAQNLFLTAKECFGYKYPNFDPIKLAELVTGLEKDRILTKIHFYTGVHDIKENEYLHNFWMNKLQGLRRAGVVVHFRILRYTRIKKICNHGKVEFINKPREKGIDVKIAIDLIRLAGKGLFDTVIIFSQDTDLNEAIHELFEIRKETNRWIRFECAYPFKEGMRNPRGLDRTQWRKISKAQYDQCIDPRDYRPKQIEPTLFESDPSSQ